MVKDLLACKEKALGLTNSDNPSLLRNGRKKGYMSIMKELWDDLGYGGLSLSAQNLRDHAAKGERNLASTSSDDVSASAAAESVGVPMQPEPEKQVG